MRNLSYSHHRFPVEIIQHAVWHNFRFPLSYRDVENLLAERGIDVSHGTVRRWSIEFGLAYARRLRRSHPPTDLRWHLDEMFASINGKTICLWRAVDCEGEVLDVLVQSRRNKNAALKLMRNDDSFNGPTKRKHILWSPGYTGPAFSAVTDWRVPRTARTARDRLNT